MSCLIQIGDVNASGAPNNFGYMSVDIDLSVQQCSNIQITIDDGTNIIAQTIVNGVSGTFVQNVALNKAVRCDENILVKVTCLDDPQCHAAEQTAVLCSAPTCCIPLSISHMDRGCVGTTTFRSIEFTITGTVTDPACLPYVLQIEFGDGQPGQSHPITATGPFTIVETHDYDTSPSTSFLAQVKHVLHPDCPKQDIRLSFDNCMMDCCPAITNTSVVVNDCEPDCFRTVTLKTEYLQYQSPCSAATLGWEIFDKDGVFVDDSGPISTGVVGPHHYDSIPLDPDGSPYKAILKTTFPLDCLDHEINFDVPICSQAPKCPEDLKLTHEDLGCEQDASGQCRRKIRHTVSGKVFSGCGPSSTDTEFVADLDQNKSWSFAESGSSNGSTFTKSTTEYYSGSGPINTSVSVSNPAGCIAIATNTVSFSECKASDCEEIPPEDPIDCILCKWCSDLIADAMQGRPLWRINLKIIICCLLIVIMALAVGVKIWSVFNCGNIPGINSTSLTGQVLDDVLNYFTLGVLIGLILLFCNICCVYCGVVGGILWGIVLVVLQWVTSGSLPQCWLLSNSGANLFFQFLNGGLMYLVGAIILAIGLRLACLELRSNI